MNFAPNKIEFHFGLEKPVKILHLTDVHLALADERNGEEKMALAVHQRGMFYKEANYPERDPVGYLQDAMEYAKEFDCTVLTGDVADFNSYKNYEVAKEILAGKDYLFCAGNHEFTPCPGIDSYPLKADAWDFIQSHFRGDMGFESRMVGEVNVVAADNGYFTWTEEQFAQLKKEVAKGAPILLFTHVPIHPHLCSADWYNRDQIIGSWGGSEELIETTVKVMNYFAEEPLFKGFCSGHWHNNAYIDFFGKPSYVVGGLFKGIVGEITVD